MDERWIVADQVFDGETLHDRTGILLAGGFVAALSPITDLPQDVQTVAINGLVTPGFVDLQVNGGGGVLFNQTPSADGIAQIAEAHRAFGTVALMPTVITDAPAVLQSAAKAALAARNTTGFAGLHIEGPHIDPQKRGTHDARYIRPMDDATLRIVEDLRAAGIPVMITLAPEAATFDQIARLAAMGAIVSLGHSNCSAADAQRAFEAGASCVTHLFNAMSQMQGRAPGLAGAAINSDVAVGLICDSVHVADDMIRLAIRARPMHDLMFLVSDAMPTVGGPDHFTLYGQDIRVQDGRLINAEGNLAGAHTTMAEGVARLVQHVGQPLETALRMAITVPANLIKAPALRQMVGRQASDIIVMDKSLSVRGNLQEVAQTAIHNQEA